MAKRTKRATETDQRRVLVIGASKGVGAETVNALLNAGYPVRALSRSGGINDDFEHEKLDVVRGDALSASDIERALDGVDIVVQTLGIPLSPRLPLEQVSLFSESTRLLIDAMRQVKVKRLIAITGYGAGDSRSSLGLLEGALYGAIMGQVSRDKTRQEAWIRNSPLDWTIMRPVFLTHKSSRHGFDAFCDPRDWRNGVISRAEVAELVVREIETGRHLRRTPLLRWR